MRFFPKNKAILIALSLNITIHFALFLAFGPLLYQEKQDLNSNRYSVKIAPSKLKVPRATPETSKLLSNSSKNQINSKTSKGATKSQAAIIQDQPRLIKGLEIPIYPKLARVRELEGNVILSFMIEPSGKLTKVLIKQSSGHRILDQSALEAALDWRFSSHQGKTSIYFEKSILYKLK